MNLTLILVFVSGLALGFLVGWFCKPSPKGDGISSTDAFKQGVQYGRGEEPKKSWED